MDTKKLFKDIDDILKPRSFNHLYAKIDYQFDKLEHDTLAKLRGKPFSFSIKIRGLEEVAKAFASIGIKVRQQNHIAAMNLRFNINQIALRNSPNSESQS